jgi:membrane fusion protein (multidrug efflux system)
MITLRALFPNPDHVLLPGMFARGELEQAVDTKAVTLLQRGVNIGVNGIAAAMVVGADDKVEIRVLQLGAAIGNKWIITDGLKAGDRVIVDGLQKVQPGVVVKPVPFNLADTNSASASTAAQGK